MQKFKESYYKRKKWDSAIAKLHTTKPYFDEKTQRVIWGSSKKVDK